MKIAVVGATGLVGSEILKVLEERNFPVSELIPVASERSVGTQVEFKGKPYTVVSVEEAIAANPLLPFSRLAAARRWHLPLNLPKPESRSLITRRPGVWTQPKNWLFLKSTRIR